MSKVDDRAYCVFELKEVNDEAREFTGIATTPTPDRYQDIVEPEGAEYKLPVPLLWQHMSGAPVGNVTRAKVSANGISVVAKLAQLDEPGTLKDRLDEAWQSLKLGLVRGLSIGFTSLEHSYIPETGGVRFLRWDWVELSLVTIPANAEAVITGMKSIDDRAAFIKRLDRQQRAASGLNIKRPVRLISSRVRDNDGSVQLFRRLK